MPMRGAPYHHTPGACQIFVGISPRHPTQDSNQYRVLNRSGNSTTQGAATYLHPLLRTTHRLQVASHGAGSTRSPSRSSSPSRLVVAASDIGAAWIGSAS
jgi:hypothetical protein